MASQALAIPELLENILLRLHTRDLLFAQKVCKTWKQVMENSPNIQRALFFKPGTIDDRNSTSDVHKLFPYRAEAAKVAPNTLLVICNDRGLFLRPGLLEVGSETSSCNRMYATQPPMQVEAEVEMWQPH
ncbi:hypothetical protein LTS10_010447 [Elasticomyces elasticus]|nr:hypothetical protein LTS10_010447 [Elasticomyces elasticus]